MNQTPSEATTKEANDEILQALRKLNSCITLTSVKDSAASASLSESSDSSQDSHDDQEEEADYEAKNDGDEQQAEWLKDWSKKKCLSISFSKSNSAKKPDAADSKLNNGRSAARETSQKETSADRPKVPPKIHKCTFCQKLFDNQNQLVSHIPSCQSSSQEENKSNTVSKLSASISITQKLPKGISISSAQRGTGLHQSEAGTTTSSQKRPFSEEEDESDYSSSEEEESLPNIFKASGVSVSQKGTDHKQASLSATARLPKGISITPAVQSGSTTKKQLDSYSKSPNNSRSAQKEVETGSKHSGTDQEDRDNHFSRISGTPKITNSNSKALSTIVNLPKGVSITSAVLKITQSRKQAASYSESSNNKGSALEKEDSDNSFSESEEEDEEDIANTLAKYSSISISKKEPKSVVTSSSVVSNFPKGISVSTLTTEKLVPASWSSSDSESEYIENKLPNFSGFSINSEVKLPKGISVSAAVVTGQKASSSHQEKLEHGVSHTNSSVSHTNSSSTENLQRRNSNNNNTEKIQDNSNCPIRQSPAQLNSEKLSSYSKDNAKEDCIKDFPLLEKALLEDTLTKDRRVYPKSTNRKKLSQISEFLTQKQNKEPNCDQAPSNNSPLDSPVSESIGSTTLSGSNSNTPSAKVEKVSEKDTPSSSCSKAFDGKHHLPQKQYKATGRKRTGNPSAGRRPCWTCKISQLGSAENFEIHHKKHVDRNVKVSLERLSRKRTSDCNLENCSEDSDSRSSSSTAGKTDDPPLKLTFKISEVRKRGRGRRKKTVSIVSSEGMNDIPHQATQNLEPPPEEIQSPVPPDNMSNYQQPAQFDDVMNPEMDLPSPHRSSEAEHDEENINLPDSNSQAPNETDPFHNFANPDPNFGTANPSEAPPSTYQPQFESYTGDWLEYDSGTRIAAAMAGTDGSTVGNNNDVNIAGSVPETRDGLFSPEMLGPAPPTGHNQRQGSFEQLCLNDSYNQNHEGQTNMNIPEQGMQQNIPYGQRAPQSSDLLSELEYLNNTGQQVDLSRVPRSDGEPTHFSPHGSNSNTPNSLSGQPTPPPTDNSFRALASSPLANSTSPMQGGMPPSSTGMSPHQSRHTPPVSTGHTPPLPNSQFAMPPGPQQTQEVTAPRLTIANNLLATTTSPSLTPPVMDNYTQQWSQNNSAQTFPSTYTGAQNMSPSMRGVNPNMPMAYRPSPRPRVRGRPPLVDQMSRPVRGPGRPPGSTMPPMIGGRGGLMGPQQRLSQNMYGTGQRHPLSPNLKRPANVQGLHSPSKSVRREDVNVPSRQKDTDCQIIAVNNRNEGGPVIANVQGGTPDELRSSRSSPSSSSESTIHLSDSITLSVRPNSTPRETERSEKGGDAGVVANLLASRGITVTPAAGDKEGAANTIRDERRLPSAKDLNLSSAISVHPPTSRDRDGFAVPHPPSAKSAAVGNSVERPARPPTVDLTLDMSQHGAMGTRSKCSQCDRSFPTQSLLADHAKVHQQQQQSRMPYKCHLCTAGFSSQKGQQHHYQSFHQLHLSAGDMAIPIVDLRNPVNVQKMQRLGIRAFLPLTNLQNRGSGGVVGIPILSLENINKGQMSLQQWGINDVLSLGPPKTLNSPR